MKLSKDEIIRRARLLMMALFLFGYAYPSAATLLGVELTSPVVLYNNAGTTTYNAGTDLFSVDASPIAINNGGTISLIIPIPGGGLEGVEINIEVDETGGLVGGVPGEDDLVVFGRVLGAGAPSGVLLTGDITDFGFRNTGGTTDLFDFLFTSTGGLLAGDFGPNIGVTLTSENSSFTGVFSESFGGRAKGNIGSGRLPPSAIPEPATLALFGIGLVGLGLGRSRKK